MDINSITVSQFKAMIDEGKSYILIDVRNPDEYEYCNLAGKLIPMQEIPERFGEIPKKSFVIVHCHHGGRSRKVIQWLSDAHGYNNLYNLEGGIHAWSIEIDSDIPIY